MIDLHCWTTPNGHKATMFLEEAGLTYRRVPVDELKLRLLTRRLPLNAESQSTLSAWKRFVAEGEPRVFPGVGDDHLKRVDRAWRRLRSSAGLRDFRFHDLRHHLASRLVQAGVPLTVRELLGHADTTMVFRYAHLSPGTWLMPSRRSRVEYTLQVATLPENGVSGAEHTRSSGPSPSPCRFHNNYENQSVKFNVESRCHGCTIDGCP